MVGMAAMVNASVATSMGATFLSVKPARFPSVAASPCRPLVVRRSMSTLKLFSSKSNGRICASAVDVSKVIPQADRILIRLESLSDQSSGGVLLPKSAVTYDRYLVGEVLAIGSAVEKIQKGNRVLVSDINAYEVNLGGTEKLCFAREGDLLAAVE